MSKKQKVVTWIGRTEPPHFGHLYYIMTLCEKFDKVVIVIGSCYEHGEIRHCISAHDREKMVRAMLKEASIPDEKYTFEFLADYEDNNVWYEELMKINRKHSSSCIATGNEWICEIVAQNGNEIEVRDFELKIPCEYRATDVRNAVINNDFELLRKMVPFSVLQILLTNDCYKSILLSNNHEAVHFVPGRQTVDMVLLLKDKTTKKLYALLGKRDKTKKDFPNVLALPGGGIENSESPTDAVVRIVREETGLLLKVEDKTFLQPPVTFENVDTDLTTMKKVGIYSSEDVTKAGTRGGSSQCFSILVEDDVDKFRKVLNPNSDLYDIDFYEIDSVSNQSLAFQHNEMLEKAMYISKAMPKIEVDVVQKKKKSICIAIMGSSGAGKSTVAHGIMYQFKRIPLSVEMASEFTKDEVYENHLQEIVNDQLYIMGEQNRRVARCIGKVDYIITDSPLPICSVHTDSKLLQEVAFSTFEQTENFIIFIKKPKDVKFETEGRLEDESTSKKISDTLEESLLARGYKLNYAKNADEALILALKFALRKEEDEEVKKRITRAIAKIKVTMGDV